MKIILRYIVDFVKYHSYILKTISILSILLLLITGMIFFYYIYPNIGIGEEQPISFSHRVHARDKQINCRFCHDLVDKSVNAGIPSLTKCFYCHSLIITKHPQIEKLKKYKETNTPVQWVRVYDVPDYVRFNHKRHILMDLDCRECHGNIEMMDRIKYHKFEMGFCINCHRLMEMSVDCVTCHY